MSRPTEPFPYGICPEPERSLSQTDKDALARIAIISAGVTLATLIALWKETR